jgi:hypothetical protein
MATCTRSPKSLIALQQVTFCREHPLAVAETDLD